jgi:hypothetical protein
MVLRSLSAILLITAVLTGSVTASGSGGVVPRFSLSATTMTVDDEVSLRVVRTPSIPQREVRIYLVPASVAAATVRSRFDSRLSFIGTVRTSRHARLVFTVPPLEAGSYALAYWCRGCLTRGMAIGVQHSPNLHVLAPVGEGCPTTKPNGKAPSARPWEGFQWHGNGALWTWLRPDGLLVTNALGGDKKIWVGKGWDSGSLRVRYQMIRPPSAPITATVVSGTLSGYNGPSWASRISFQPGCWQITGRLGDASLSFVVQVVLGTG